MDSGARTSSVIKREFLGWDRPALPVAVQRIARYARNKTLDLSKVIVVVPGQRAGRRLLELLAFHCEDHNLLLTPPTVVTQGRLPEMLYTPKLPFATELVQDLAWSQALRELPAKERRHIIPQDLADTAAWIRLGQVFRRLHVELAADGLNFERVSKVGPELADFSEAERWRALVSLQNRYHAILDKQELWDIQTARLKAIEFKEIQTDCDIILLGTADLNNTLRQMLDQVAERVVAYIIAPENLASRFDAYGCLIPDAWCEEQIPLEDKQIVQVDGPEEQADAVSEWLSQIAPRFTNDAVAIGVPDEALVPQLQRQLAQCNVKSRWVEGVRLSETSAFRLLQAAVRFAETRHYDDLAALLRHPEVESWLSPRSSSLIAELDKYHNTCLPGRVDSIAEHRDWPGLPLALRTVDAWLESGGEPRGLRAWGEFFAKVLSRIYESRTLDLTDSAQETLHDALRAILDACDRLTSIPRSLDAEPLSASEAFELALGPLGASFLPPPAEPDAVEILGWLELPLDDSTAVVVTSFNEGFVPQSAGADPFLPDRLRQKLAVMHNGRRYARDAYATSVLCHGRRELRIVVARRDVNDNLLQPSRLLFAAPEKQTIARARRLFGEKEATPKPPRLLFGVPPRERSLFERPPAEPPEAPLQQMRVTDFKLYLESPYRYYLRMVKRLRAVDDAARELDQLSFGTLVHDVLGAFGRDTHVRNSTKAKAIVEFVMEELERVIKQRYGQARGRPALRLQIELARRCLRAFADEQAAIVKEGWRILYAESDTREQLEVPFPVDQTSVSLTGRIDRIDYHEGKGALRILDYKTSARGEEPNKTHRSGDDWVDLQLPLYRHLWPKAPVKFPKVHRVELGYFNLPKRMQDTRVAIAPWTDEVLAGADDVAREVMRNVRLGKFKDLGSVRDDDEYASICMTNTLMAPELVDDEFTYDQGK